MPTFKITYVFNAHRYGWSETWYTTVSTHDIALQAAKSVAPKRARLLGNGNVLEMARVSDVDIPQDSKVYFFGGDQAVQVDDADTPWNAILARVEAGPLYRRQCWLRGIPDSWIVLQSVNGINLPPGALNQAFNQFKIAILANGFALRVIDKSPPNGTPVDVTAIANGAEGKVALSIAGIVGGPGKEVRIKGFIGPDKFLLNGVHKIISNAGGVVTIDLDFNLLTNPAANVAGKGVSRVIIYAPIEDAILLRPAKKSTGRAFFVSRGRQPKQA